MKGGELLSLLINLGVGGYLALFYPRALRRRFAHHPMPRGFALLLKVVPPAGWLIIALTLAYGASRLVIELFQV